MCRLFEETLFQRFATPTCSLDSFTLCTLPNLLFTLPAFYPACFLPCLHSSLPALVHARMPALPPACLPACLPACPPARPPARPPACLPARPPATPRMGAHEQHGRRPLHAAVSAAHVAVVEELIAAGADVDATDHVRERESKGEGEMKKARGMLMMKMSRRCADRG